MTSLQPSSLRPPRSASRLTSATVGTVAFGLALGLCGALFAWPASAQAPPGQGTASPAPQGSPPGDAAKPAGGAAGRTGSSAPASLQGEVKLTQSFAVVDKGEVKPVSSNDAEPPRITVGTPVILSLSVARPAATSLTLPEQQNTGRYELVRVERQPVSAEPGASSVVEEVKLSFAVFRPGTHTLESFELKVMDAEGAVSSLKTSPITVKVVSVIANEKDPQMPARREPVSVWIEDWTLTWLAGGLLGLLLAGLIGAWLYRALAPPPPPPPPPPPRPAHEIALEKLGAIAASDLIAAGEVEEFYVRVSNAVREYLGRRYNLSLTDQAGLELTTEELLEPLRDVRWPRGMDFSFVALLLQDCDIVKFARYTPTQEEADDILRRAFQLVELTRQTVLGDQALVAGGQAAEASGDADGASGAADEAIDALRAAAPAEDAQGEAADAAGEGADEASPWSPQETDGGEQASASAAPQDGDEVTSEDEGGQDV